MFEDKTDSDVFLVNIVGDYKNEDNVPEKKKTRSFTKAVAQMSDGSELKFPPDVVMFPDNHYFDDVSARPQLRLRVAHPIGDDGKPVGPSFLIPQRCSLQFVINAIKRCEKKV